MNILYVAYSCDPYNGSEDKLGWNIPYHNSKDNKIWVITKEEQRENITKFFNSNEHGNLEISYVDIPTIYKKLFNGFFYSTRLGVWNRRAYKVAKKIVSDNDIDIIHQIAPIEFRSIGKYGKIQNCKFVCGPIGGGEYIPKALRGYARKYIGVELIRLVANCFSVVKYKVTRYLNSVDYLMFSNYETRDYLKKIYGKTSVVMDETAVDEQEVISHVREKMPREKMVFLVAGRLVYRKGHHFLLDSIARIDENAKFECRIVGSGSEEASLENRVANDSKLRNRVSLLGAIPYTEMRKEYENADVLIMPSLRETTGSVLLEAMSNGIPIITMDAFGGAYIVNDNNGWKYSGNTREEYINNLKTIMEYCIENPDIVASKRVSSLMEIQKHLWSKKVELYNSIYEKLLMENN